MRATIRCPWERDIMDVQEERMAEREWPEGHAWDDTVIGYNLAAEQLAMLRQAAAAAGVQVCATESAVDLLAVPAFLAVIRPVRLGLIEKETFADWVDMTVRYVEPRRFGVLFTHPPAEELPRGFAKFVTRTPEHLDAESLKLKILHQRMAMRRHDRHLQGLERRLFRLLHILKVLRARGILYPADYHREFRASRRTLQRDMAVLNALNELVEYDKDQRGYVLLDASGLNFGDLPGAFPPPDRPRRRPDPGRGE
ncbi:MAG: hypothetical protein JXL20_01955 [Deltaproteobacteria bacterium]|nr:hypothetical protein [Deltaproteobacteria bacterium]